MEWNSSAGKQWGGRHWCRRLHSNEGEIWSGGVRKSSRILKVRQTALFTVFTIDLNFLCSEWGVDVLQNILYSKKLCSEKSIKYKLENYPPFPFTYLCSLIHTKSLRQTTVSRTALHINLFSFYHTWVDCSSLPSA